MKWLWTFGGWVSLTLGIIGIFLPIAPTTPFVILAAFLFSKGSPKFHQWLMAHPRFGPLVREWESDRVIRLKAKWFTTVMLSLSNLWVWGFLDAVPWQAKAAMSAVCLGVLIFVWSCPSMTKAEAAALKGVLPANQPNGRE